MNCNSAVAVYNHNLRVCAVCKSIVSTYVHTTLRTFYTNYNYSLRTLHVERARSLSTFTTSNPSQDLLQILGYPTKGKTHKLTSLPASAVVAPRVTQVQQILAVDIFFVKSLPFLLGELIPLGLHSAYLSRIDLLQSSRMASVHSSIPPRAEISTASSCVLMVKVL